MGNVQSQTPDDDGVPRYNYHENVLRDAQTAVISCDTEPTNSGHGDEQYFSAEESDSVRSSLTPERTRPESSSDEHLSDSRGSNEDIIIEDSGRSEPHEGHILMHEVGIHVSAATSSERPTNSFRGMTDNPQPSLDVNLQKRDVVAQLSDSQEVRISSPLQFVPVDPAPNLILCNTSLGSEKCVANPGKRKIAEDSTSESSVPRKRMLTRSSSKRKRLGYTDSSESEMGEKEKVDIRKPHKKGKIIIQSPKKSRRLDRDFRDRDSDERRFEKKRRLKNSRCDYDSDSSESEVEAEKHWLNKAASRRKRGRKYSSDNSSDISDETSRYKKKRRSKRNQTIDTDRNESMKSYKHVSSQCDHQTNHEDVASHQSQEAQVSLSEVTRNMVISNMLNNSCTDTSVSADMSNRPCHTFKMGNQSLRNSQGKVFPLRNVSPRDSACSTADLVIHSVPARSDLGSACSTADLVIHSVPARSDLGSACSTADARSDLGNTVINFRPRYSDSVSFHDSVNLQSSPLEKSQVLQAGKNPLNNLPALARQTSTIKSKWALPHPDSDSLLQDKLDVSPFKNVILVPPSTHGVVKRRLEQPAIDKLTQSFKAEESTSDMEVEDSDVTLENHTASQFLDLVPSSMRGVLQRQHRQKTVTARFKTFWSEKKKNLGENLKSLFSKVQSPSSETQLNSVGPVWETFTASSRSLQNTCSAWNSSQDPQLKLPITFLNRSHQQESFLQRQVTSEQHQDERLTVQPAGIKEQMSADSTPQLVVFRSDVTRTQCVNRGSVTTQELPGILTPTGSKLPHSSVAATNYSVECLPQTKQYQVLDCCLAGEIDISISTGNIADQKTAAIVNWTDGALQHTATSCSRSIAAKAGALMRAACNDYIETKGSNLEAPDVLTTPAGGRFDRAVKAILHVVAPSWVNGCEASNSRTLMETFANCLRFAHERLSLDSISFPLIGNGIVPFSICVKSFFDGVLLFLAEQSGRCSLSHIQLIIPDITAASLSADMVRSYLERVCDRGLESEVENTYHQYFGHKQNVGKGTKLNINACSPQQSFTVERTTSGRPRLKRPRF